MQTLGFLSTDFTKQRQEPDVLRPVKRSGNDQWDIDFQEEDLQK